MTTKHLGPLGVVTLAGLVALAGSASASSQGAEVVNTHECTVPYEGATVCVDSNLVIKITETPSGFSSYVQHERTDFVFNDVGCTQSGQSQSIYTTRSDEGSLEGFIVVGTSESHIDCLGFKQTCQYAVHLQLSKGQYQVIRDELTCTTP